MSDLPLRDKEQGLTLPELFKNFVEVRRLDRYAVAMKLFDKTLKWYHTNIQNKRDSERILQVRTWTNISQAYLDQLTNSQALTDTEHLALKTYNEETHKVVLQVTEDYAELRISAKGFRAKQTERILSGETKSEKELDKIFKKGDKPQ